MTKPMNRAALVASLGLILCVNGNGYAEPSAKPGSAMAASQARKTAGGSIPDSLPSDADSIDITGKMGDLLSKAKESGEVMRLWADWKSGKKEAVPQIFVAARNGNARAQNLAGYMLDNGEGVKKDSTAAAAYFSHAAESLPLAKYNLGVLYNYGRGVRKDERKAMDLFKASATGAGVEQACVQLALYYLKNKNENEAYRWANEGANRGNVKAFYLLGRILYQRQQYKAAWSWIQKAASASEQNSPAIVSLMYKDGLGVGKNSMLAAAWWLIYTSYSRKQVGNNLTVVSSFNLTEEEQRRAVNFAHNWIATHRPDKRINYRQTLIQTN